MLKQMIRISYYSLVSLIEGGGSRRGVHVGQIFNRRGVANRKRGFIFAIFQKKGVANRKGVFILTMLRGANRRWFLLVNCKSNFLRVLIMIDV